MGKKSLIKSTAKKRPPKKGDPAAQTDKKPPVKKSAAPQQPATPSSPTPKPSATPKTAPVSLNALLKKQFSIEIPKIRYTVPAKMVAQPAFTASDPYAGMETTTAERIKRLLFNSYTEADLAAAAEKAAAEKAAAEKAAAEKAAAEKAAAEKAAAEKAAAEKAAAEKAAAEKAAAEKAAAEKAAAEKAAAEKAAAEKAAAEKAAAEKAAAEKAAAARAVVEKPSDPVDTSIKILAAVLALLILLVVGASISNSSKYYLIETPAALEIWKGTFAPKGRQLVIALPGIPAPDPVKAVYRSDEVYPIAADYYIDKADALLDVPGIPDFGAIRINLENAAAFASSKELQTIVDGRLNTIERLVLTYRAEVAAGRGTINGLTSAIGLLKEAARLTTDSAQAALITQRITDHEAQVTALKEAAAAADVPTIPTDPANEESTEPATAE